MVKVDTETVFYDKKQYKLNPDLSITENNFKFAKDKVEAVYDTKVLCPFCLNTDILAKFRLHKGLRVCPYCTLTMKLETLTNLNNMEEFVKFVFNYRFMGFFREKICLDFKPTETKTRFDEWNRRLYLLGLSKSFWEKYEQLKGETPKREYEEDY